MGLVIISWGGMARSLVFSFLGVAAVGTVALSLPMQGVFRDPTTLIPADETTLAFAQNQYLIWPATGNISQGFHRYHEGLDIAGPIGTPILAAQAGEVILAGWDDWGLGYAVEILHNDGSRTVYGHNQLLYVNVGEQVMQGQAIAEMGNTGNSTGPHLHFEYYGPNGDSRDPLTNLPALVDGRIPPAVPPGEQCPGDVLLAAQTRNFRVQICQVGAQVWYFGQANNDPRRSIWLPAFYQQDRYEASNGSFTYWVYGDRLDVYEGDRRLRSEQFNAQKF